MHTLPHMHVHIESLWVLIAPSSTHSGSCAWGCGVVGTKPAVITR
jgi:hypothetical protein